MKKESIFCYCPQCGQSENIDRKELEVYVDLSYKERKCDVCKTIMIIQCVCGRFIESLEKNKCSCGEMYPHFDTIKKPKMPQIITRKIKKKIPGYWNGAL